MSVAPKNKAPLKARLAYVTPPDQAQLDKIRAFLSAQEPGREVELSLVEDKSLVAGFVLTAGDKEYDWSGKGQLDALKDAIVASL